MNVLFDFFYSVGQTALLGLVLSHSHVLLNWTQFFRNKAKCGLQLWTAVSTAETPPGHCTSSTSFFKKINKYQSESNAFRKPVAQSCSCCFWDSSGNFLIWRSDHVAGIHLS